MIFFFSARRVQPVIRSRIDGGSACGRGSQALLTLNMSKETDHAHFILAAKSESFLGS
jgi:hypothetical protein